MVACILKELQTDKLVHNVNQEPLLEYYSKPVQKNTPALISKRKFRNHSSSMMCIFLATVLCGLASLYLNVRMLMTCFRDEGRHPFLKQRRALVISMFVAQITVLTRNTTEAWTELELLSLRHEESCFPVYQIVSTFGLFFSGAILLVMLVIDSGDAQSYCHQEVLPRHLVLATMTVGFLGSANVRWYSCFSSKSASEITFSAILFVCTIAGLVFVAWKTCLHLASREAASRAASSLLKVFKEHCETVIFVVAYFIFAAMMTARISRLSFCLSGQIRAYEKSCYLFIVNFAVGIAFPLKVTDLNDSRYKEESGKSIVMII